MKEISWIRVLLISLLVSVNVGFDQVSKTIVRQQIDLHETIEVIGPYFILTKAENTGAFLSLGNDWPAPVRKTLLLVLPSLALLVALGMIFLQKDLSRGMQIGLSCAIGGGIGNIYDRIRFGSVTDFMHIDLEFARTGIFNIADVSIMFGLLLTLFLYFQEQRKKAPAVAEDSSPQA
jgi:signal peptidase II